MERAIAMGPWCVLMLAAVIGGCGGGAAESLAGSSTGAVARVRPQSVSKSASTEGQVADKSQWPQVVQLEQVAATRVDRTQYDYTFAVHLRGSGLDIKDGRFTVTAVGEGSTVRDGVATFTSLNAGRYQVLSDTITIRHDRTRPFDASKIAFDFNGTIAVQVTTGSTAPRIANVSFSAFGGRPGHEGYFKIDSSDPAAGQQVELTAVVRGSTGSASFQLVTPGGTPISGADLIPPKSGRDEFNALTTVPNQDFIVRVVATAPDGARATWNSDVFHPRRQLAQFAPAGGGPFARGQDVTGEIVIGPTPSGESSEVSLLLPAGFAAAQSKWQVPPSTGVTRIPVRITTPAGMPPLTFVELSVALKLGADSQRWVHSTHMLAR